MILDQSYPCPNCGEHGLVYDGMLAWRSGPRPPRRLARKNVRLSIRADYEREYIYHCEHCNAEFWQDAEQRRRVHLYQEGMSGQYVYDSISKHWQTR